YFLVATAVSSPISDMFAYIDAYLRYRAGEVSLVEYLWRAHGEHHLVWTRLLTWADVARFGTRGIGGQKQPYGDRCQARGGCFRRAAKRVLLGGRGARHYRQN